MLPEINLLPKIKRHSSISYILFLIGSLIVIALFITLTVFYFHFKGKLNVAENEYQELVLEKEILEQQLATLEASETETLETAVLFAEQLILPASPLLEEFVEQLPNNSLLKSYTYNNDFVSIQSQHKDISNIATYVNNLVTSDFMKDVKLNSVDSSGSVELDEDHYYNAVHNVEINRKRLLEEVHSHE